jgi:hypothetical protein
MNEIFLSASVPIVGRGNYHETADPFLIQYAVRELVISVIRSSRIVWGGHPAITPMIWAICESLGVDYSQSVVLYQSKFFSDFFPEENQKFKNVNYVDAVNNDLNASLLKMRIEMLSRPQLSAAVFIGGMEGIHTEYDLFKSFHPRAKVLPVGGTGGAAGELAHNLYAPGHLASYSIDFASLFHTELP